MARTARKKFVAAVLGATLLVACSTSPQISQESGIGADMTPTALPNVANESPSPSTETSFEEVRDAFNKVLGASGPRFVGNIATTDFIEKKWGGEPDEYLVAMATDHIRLLQFLDRIATELSGGFCQNLIRANESREAVDEYLMDRINSTSNGWRNSESVISDIQSDLGEINVALGELNPWCLSVDRVECQALATGTLSISWPSVNSLISSARSSSVAKDIQKIFNRQDKQLGKYLSDFPCEPDSGLNQDPLIVYSDCAEGSQEWIPDLASGVSDERARYVLDVYRSYLQDRQRWIEALVCRETIR